MNAFQEYFVNVLKTKYFQPQGRARRREYWMFTLFGTIAILVLTIIGSIISDTLGTIIYVVCALGLLAPGITVCIRRLHDIGKSGWWALIGLVPLVGIVLIVFMCLDSQPGENIYGPNPKGF